MERTATARGTERMEPMRLPAEFELAQVEVEGAVHALRVLIAIVAETVARKEARQPHRAAIMQCGPRLRQEQAA